MKYSIAILCLIHSSLLIAGGMESLDTPCIHQGFYLGGALGVAGLGDKEAHSASPETHQLGEVGFLGGGYIGYEYGIKPVGIAVEIFGDGTGLHADIAHDPYTYHRSQSYDLGIRALPEYAFTSTTRGHIVLGYMHGKFNITDNGVYGYINNGFRRSGFQTGLGFKTALSPNLLLRWDALYAIYPSQTSAGLGLTSGTTQLYTNTFSTLAGVLSLIYLVS